MVVSTFQTWANSFEILESLFNSYCMPLLALRSSVIDRKEWRLVMSSKTKLSSPPTPFVTVVNSPPNLACFSTSSISSRISSIFFLCSSLSTFRLGMGNGPCFSSSLVCAAWTRSTGFLLLWYSAKDTWTTAFSPKSRRKRTRSIFTRGLLGFSMPLSTTDTNTSLNCPDSGFLKHVSRAGIVIIKRNSLTDRKIVSGS